MFTFEEDVTSQPLELLVKQVVSVVKSADEKVSFGLPGRFLFFKSEGSLYDTCT